MDKKYTLKVVSDLVWVIVLDHVEDRLEYSISDLVDSYGYTREEVCEFMELLDTYFSFMAKDELHNIEDFLESIGYTITSIKVLEV